MKHRQMRPARLVLMAFVLTALLGSVLLYLPFTHRPGVEISYIDALYTSVATICVTGLSVVDIASTFNSGGKLVLAILIQAGGLGVTTLGAGVLLSMGQKLGFRERSFVHDSLNLASGSGVVRFLHSLFLTTFVCEIIGMILTFCIIIEKFPPMQAFGISLFHSVSSFNNAGMDVFGGEEGIMAFANDPRMIFLTTVLVFFGSLGFIVIYECWRKKFHWRIFSMHTQVSIFMGFVLLVGGAAILKYTENLPWLVCFFSSMNARSSGFDLFPAAQMSAPGFLMLTMLMFIGASPASTGGGVKTSSVFALALGLRRVITNEPAQAFHYSLPKMAVRKASLLISMAIADILVCTFFLLLFCPHLTLSEAFMEIFSSFTTVGFTTGVTETLTTPGKLLAMLAMFTGRIGPITVATVWYFTDEKGARYPEGDLLIG